MESTLAPSNALKLLIATLRNIMISVRPYQWVKNILVFAALFFSLSFFSLDALLLSIRAFTSFCLVSSGIYLLNDYRDRHADKLHPLKKNRPIAAGKISTSVALTAMILFLSAGLMISLFINLKFLILITGYIALNTGYSLGLKKVVLLDVMIVAMGFLLRAMAGAYAIEVAVSPWLFICTLLLSLLLVFGKRRQELALMEGNAGSHRKSLEEYTLPFIDGLMFISAGAAIVTYSLYTMAEDVVSRFNTHWLIATTPLAIYGIFRYLYLIYIKKEGGDPTKLMVKDKPFVFNALLWVLMIIAILYKSILF